MFTGLVQAIGTISHHGSGVSIDVPSSFFPLTIGESISVDGVCLTVASLGNRTFVADVSEETLKRTGLGEKASRRAFVNLEPALRLSDRLGGHLVSGHVDGLGKVISITPLANSWNLEIRWEDSSFAKYSCDKASIAVNGISLTISEIKEEGNIFSIAIISHTWTNTSLQYLTQGETVNLEADLLAKYVESLLITENSHKNKLENNLNISKDWLTKNGFL